jgi:hypothetical protein
MMSQRRRRGLFGEKKISEERDKKIQTSRFDERDIAIPNCLIDFKTVKKQNALLEQKTERKTRKKHFFSLSFFNYVTLV